MCLDFGHTALLIFFLLLFLNDKCINNVMYNISVDSQVTEQSFVHKSSTLSAINRLKRGRDHNNTTSGPRSRRVDV